MKTLREIKTGETVRVKQLGGNGELRQHFLDMGIIPGAEITFVKYAPLGDPMEFRLHGYELTLRVADAQQVEVCETDAADTALRQNSAAADSIVTEHPGLGESGKFHDKNSENPLPDGTILTFALVGNQNCG